MQYGRSRCEKDNMNLGLIDIVGGRHIHKQTHPSKPNQLDKTTGASTEAAESEVQSSEAA